MDDIDKLRRVEVRGKSALAESGAQVILVDGPSVCADDTIGRMQSICFSSLIAAACHPCHVFVDDIEREVEHAYALRYLGGRCLRNVIARSDGSEMAHFLVQ